MVLVPTVHCNGSNITGSKSKGGSGSGSGTLNASGDSSGIDSGT